MLAWSAEALVAQVVSGRVVDGESHPIVGATLVDVASQRGTVSDADGRFNIPNVRTWPLTIVVRCLGYRPDSVSFARPTHDAVIRLEEEEVVKAGVDVVGHGGRAGFEGLDASVATVAASADGGVEGLLKSQMGVASNSELSSQYRVRGGNFDENIVYVNGVEIYRPFLIRAGEQEGLSFINPDMVGSINFSAGGFDASYGDKMSSVLDVSYKRPTERHGSLRVSLLGASGHFEGLAAEGRFAHTTGVRYKTNQYLFGSLDTKGDYAPRFFDAQTFCTFLPSDAISVSMLGYVASNRYDFKPKDRETTFGTISDAKKLKIYFFKAV